MYRLRAGARIVARQAETISGREAPIPHPEEITHLQFRRFAGCPVCSLHLRSFAARSVELASAGVREAIFFHSGTEELIKYAADLPFDVIADPLRATYAEFGVEIGARALLNPRGWPAIFKAVVAGLWRVAIHGEPMPPVRPNGGSLGLPADFLIAPDGRVLAVKYGDHIDDHWCVDEVLAISAMHRKLTLNSTAGATL